MAAPNKLAHQVADGRWLLTGGGGYEPLRDVPRTWTHLLAEAAGHPIDPRARIPAAWREHASRRTGRQAPELMTEGDDPAVLALGQPMATTASSGLTSRARTRVTGIPIIWVTPERLTATAGGHWADFHDPEYTRNEPGRLNDQRSSPSSQEAQIR